MRSKINSIIEMEKALHALVMQVENESTAVENQVENQQAQVVCPFLPPKPDIHYAGDKIEFIRILLSLCLLNRFKDSAGNLLPACKVFQMFGDFLGEKWDNGRYLKALDRTKQDSTSMKTQTKIFKEMEEAIRKYFENK